MEEQFGGEESVVLSPTWSVATVMTGLLAVSLLVERTIHHLSSWLKRTNRNPLCDTLEKMKEELMLLGFMSLFLTATSRIISSICIGSKLVSSRFAPCTRSKVPGARLSETGSTHNHNQSTQFDVHHLTKRLLSDLNHHTCEEGLVPFTSNEVLEQLDRFIFVMAVTHVAYSCLTMLLASAKMHTWRKWEDEAQREEHSLPESRGTSTMWRHLTLMKFHSCDQWSRHRYLLWVACFVRQFGYSVGREDYLTLRKAFILNHNLAWTYDFHSYMIRSMEDEFKTIVGISLPLWGFIIGFMLFDVKGSNLYFWASFIPVTLVLLVGTKLQHIIATLTLENAAITGFFSGTILKPRDGLFWFKRPELVLSLIHFVLFQNAFELASFLWFWWHFGYDSCLLINSWAVHLRLIMGFAGQFLCSYSTLPLHALVTQMGSNYKAALIPPRVREMVRDWGAAARKRRRRGAGTDESTTTTETSAHRLIEEDELSEYAQSLYGTTEQYSTYVDLHPFAPSGLTSGCRKKKIERSISMPLSRQ